MCTCIRPCSRLTDLPQALTTAPPTPPRSSSSFPRPPLRSSWSSTSWHRPASSSSCAGAVFGASARRRNSPSNCADRPLLLACSPKLEALANRHGCCVTADHPTVAQDLVQGNGDGFARGHALWQFHFDRTSAGPFEDSVDRIGCNLIAPYSDRQARHLVFLGAIDTRCP